MNPVKIFIAYSHKDLAAKDELKTHLSPLEMTGRAQIWDDYEIEGGQKWEQEILKSLNAAQVILLLVSKDSLASKYFYGKEVTLALERHEKGEAVVIPVILSPCMWTATPLQDLEAVPDKGKPISKWSDQDDAYHDAAHRIKDVVDKQYKILNQTSTPSSTPVQHTRVASPTGWTQAENTQHSIIPPPSDMIFIKGGTYSMGDLFGEGEPREKPHSVTVNDFYLGATVVTFDQYDAFCAATKQDKPSDANWGRGKRPVINIDWYDTLEYCNWRSEQEKLQACYTIDPNTKDPNNNNDKDTKKWKVTCDWSADGYRLPTEAEWEYAAREGGKKVRFGNGRDTIDPSEINFNGKAEYKKDYSIVGEYRAQTVPCGSLNSPNALGLHDMSGNVWEWCWDWFDEKYYSQSDGARNPRGAFAGQYRCVRGGSWNYGPYVCRAAFRYDGYPYDRDYDIGFRVVRH